jgi:hypothetical protein
MDGLDGFTLLGVEKGVGKGHQAAHDARKRQNPKSKSQGMINSDARYSILDA